MELVWWAGYGTEALRIAVMVSEQAGCRCVIVDAYPSVMAWWERYGFPPIEGGKGSSVRMYLDLRVVKAAQQQEGGNNGTWNV